MSLMCSENVTLRCHESMNHSYNLDDLKYLMKRLREPEFGCPWDIKQDFNTIIPYTIEECYEVIDAIENQQWQHLSVELGDLLFQIIFYSEMADEQCLFNLDQVVDQLVKKLITRHPHVFPDQQLHDRCLIKPSDQQIAASWETIKQQEREQKGQLDQRQAKVLDDIPRALPALSRAQKMQKRAANVGFDWADLTPVIAKIEEELAELKEALQGGNIDEIRDEMGDVLFSQVNLARHLNVNAEQALRATNEKFTRRFNFVEEQVVKSEQDWSQYSLDSLEQFWLDAKKAGL